MKVHRLLQNSFFQGSVAFTFSSFIVNLLNYFFNLLVAKKLGPVGFGEISSMFAFIAIFSVPMTVMSMVLIQKIGQQKKNQYAYASSLDCWFRRKIIHLRLPIIAICALFPFIQYVTNLSPITSAAILPLIIIGTVGTFYSSLLQGLHLLGWASIVGVVVVMIKLIGVLVPVGGSGELVSIVIALILSSGSMVMIPRIILRNQFQTTKNNVFHHTSRLRHVLHHRQSLITLASLTSITIIGNFDVVTAKRVMTPLDAGVYSSWGLFAKIILYGLGPVLTMSYIFFSSKKNESHHNKLLLISLLTLLGVGCVAYSLYTLFGSLIVTRLFSSTFTPVVPFLPLASLFGILYAGISLLNNYFLSRGSFYSLIISVAVVPYIIAIVFAGQSLVRFMYANIVVTGIIFIIQLSSVIQYNYARWKQNKRITSSA